MPSKHLVVALLSILVLISCEGNTPPPAATTMQPDAGTDAIPTPAPVPDSPVPYEYPAPVTGRIEEINVGAFDLVDGIAYAADDGSGTVVYALSKAIASPLLKDSRCLRAHADALALLRDAGFAEVTLDAEGESTYFGYGKLIGGSGRDLSPGGTQWSSELEISGPGASGSVKHRHYGEFKFDLPLRKNTPATQGDTATEKVLATYDKIRQAVAARDLAAILRPQGFDEAQIAAISGLPGIEQDVDGFAMRFLSPGDPAPDTVHAGGFYVDGTNPSGERKWISYGFVRCGEYEILTAIYE